MPSPSSPSEAPLSAEALIRVMRVFGMSVRQIVEVQRELFREQVEERLLDGGMAYPEMLEASASTRLTESAGDAGAAEHGGRLTEIAAELCAGAGGRLVKTLGDGVMLRFDRALEGLGDPVPVFVAGRSPRPG